MYRNQYTQGHHETQTEAGGQVPEDGTNEALADAGSTPAASPAGGPETPNRLEENGPWLRGPLRGPANAPIEDPSRALAGGAPPHEGAGVGLAAPAPHSPREAELGAQPVPWGCSQGHPKPALRPLCAALVLTWVLPTSPAMCSPCSNSRLRGGTPSRCSRARLGTARTPPHTHRWEHRSGIWSRPLCSRTLAPTSLSAS